MIAKKFQYPKDRFPYDRVRPTEDEFISQAKNLPMPTIIVEADYTITDLPKGQVGETPKQPHQKR